MTAHRGDPTPTYKPEDRNRARETERYNKAEETTMTTTQELAEVLLQITSELAGLNIAADGEVVRRIGSLICEARELLQQLAAEDEVPECQCSGAQR